MSFSPRDSTSQTKPRYTIDIANFSSVLERWTNKQKSIWLTYLPNLDKPVIDFADLTEEAENGKPIDHSL